jgi:5'-deoxynucleotidase YfbR-like HD superfamily hydrolase
MQMTLYTGRRVDPWNLTVQDIDIVAIAHSLSNLCRFGGHTNKFYSVAQHCIRVASIVPKEDRLEGLLHDATEAYIQDVVRPVKIRLKEYKELEHRVWMQFAFKYGLPGSFSETIKRADDASLKSEIRQFLNNPGRDIELADPYWTNVEEVDEVHRTLAPDEAEAMFLMTYADAIAQRVEFIQKGVVKCGRCIENKCRPECVFYDKLHSETGRAVN